MRNSPLFLFLAACSCQTAPRFEHTTATGLARANDIDDARGIAHMAERFAHRVTSILGVPLEPKFVVYYDDRNDRFDGHVLVWLDSNGRITKRRIEMGAGSRPALRFILAHELVHYYTTGPWERLPYTIEEGLGDYIALQIAPEFTDWRLDIFDARCATMSLSEAESLLAITSTERPTTVWEQRGMFAIGFRVVEQLGIEHLRHLCERAEREGEPRIPLDWILASVTLPPDIPSPVPAALGPAR